MISVKMADGERPGTSLRYYRMIQALIAGLSLLAEIKKQCNLCQSSESIAPWMVFSLES